LKPFLRGRDVKRWCIESEDIWLIFVPWHFPLHDNTNITGASLKAEAEFREKYPAIYKHLSQFKKELLARNAEETGIRYEWYALQRCAAGYWQAFAQPRIVYQVINRTDSYAYDPKSHFSNDKTFIIPTKDLFLLAILNSKACTWFLHALSGVPVGGFFNTNKPIMEKIPIPAASAAEQAALSGLVDGILAAKRTGDAATVTALESEIDTHVFRLYALTPAEIALVKSTDAK
jgi:hypothetical protein